MIFHDKDLKGPRYFESTMKAYIYYLCINHDTLTMKNYLVSILTMIIIAGSSSVFLLSCSKDKDQPDYYINTPIAGFTYSGNEGPAPVTIQFYNTSQNADVFEWTFGDGYSSSERDPSHSYYNTTNETKTYLVVLKATDSSSGLYQRKSKSIAIQPGGKN